MNGLLFEYKVRTRHRLGWKEFSFYATTDIEEFLNRNSIDYVRNCTDTVESRLFKEIERLNNIINELEHDFESYELEYLQETYQGSLVDFIETELERIQELKGSDKK